MAASRVFGQTNPIGIPCPTGTGMSRRDVFACRAETRKIFSNPQLFARAPRGEAWSRIPQRLMMSTVFVGLIAFYTVFITEIVLAMHTAPDWPDIE